MLKLTKMRSWRNLAMVVIATTLPTHLFADVSEDKARVDEILHALDDREMSPETRATFFHENAVILAPDQPPARGLAEILTHLEGAAAAQGVRHTHFTRSIERFDDVVVTEGGVTGEWRERPDSEPVRFATNNIILLREDRHGVLKIWKVIFNATPVDSES